MNRSYLPSPTAALEQTIADGWRGDMSSLGRALKAAGVSGRDAMVQAVKAAAAEKQSQP